MITLSHVTKDFAGPAGDTLRILDDVNFTLETPTSCAIVGPSGSGKSTLLTLLAGLERPTAGTIRMKEIELDRLSESALSAFRARNVGIVFQSFHLFAHFTALQNVMVAAEIAQLDAPRARALDALAKVGLAHRVSHKPSRLSGGEQQRVAIARAIVANPGVLLCDEPTGNLDPHNADIVFTLLLDLCKDLKSTLVMVTHDSNLADRLEQKVEIERGRVKSVRPRVDDNSAHALRAGPPQEGR